MAPESSRKERAAPRNGSERPSPVALLSIAAIGVVVLLVALPSINGLAVSQNEQDAVRVVRALGLAAADGEVASLGSVAELFEAHPELAHRFRDLELLEDATALRAHGYLFDYAPLGTGFVVRAWPWEHARTGFAAIVYDSASGLRASPNRDGLASGPGAPPRYPDESAAWRALR